MENLAEITIIDSGKEVSCYVEPHHVAMILPKIQAETIQVGMFSRIKYTINSGVKSDERQLSDFFIDSDPSDILLWNAM